MTGTRAFAAAAGACAAAFGIAVTPGRVPAALPPGWTVHTFAGRIHEIEPAGGVLACATDGGLLFFDPQTRSFGGPVADAGCADGNCLTSNRLTSVSRDASGAYWLGTEASGAVVYRPGQGEREFGRFFTRNAAPGGGLLADSVFAVEAWRSTTVYVGTNRGVGQIDLEAGVDSYNPDVARILGTDVKGSVLHDLAVDSLYVWVATDSGVSRYDRQPQSEVEFLPDSLEGREAFTIEILNGTVYAGSPVGIFTWQEASRSWQRVRSASQTPPEFKALSIARQRNGRLLVGSEGGVYIFTGFVWGAFSPPPVALLGDRQFTSIVATGDTLWTSQHNLAGEGAYLERWTAEPAPGGWTRFEPSAIPPSAVQVLDLGPQGDLWIGTQLAGVAHLTTAGTWCIYNGNDPTVRANMSDPEGHTSALLADRGGTVWLHAMPSTNGVDALDRLQPDPACNHAADAWDHVQPGERRFVGRYWRALEDGEGNRFFLSDGNPSGEQLPGGLDVLSADEQLAANVRGDTLGGNSVGALAFETEVGAWQRAYLGLNGLGSLGLKLWNRAGQLFGDPPPGPANFTTLPLPSSISPGEFRDIVVMSSSARRLWVGTDSGIFEYDAVQRDTVSGTYLRAKIDDKPGLLSGDVKDLQLDDFGNLWVATVKGLNRVRLAERQPGRRLVVDAFTTLETIRERNAGSSVGQLYDPRRALAPLPSPKVTALAYDAASDRLYVATDAGVAVVDVEGISRRPQIPLADALIYPNPARLDAGHEEVKLARVSEPATVTIFTLEGDIVCEVTDREDGDVVWSFGTPSCLDSEGNVRAASGAYLVRITTSAGSTMRTLVVIR